MTSTLLPKRMPIRTNFLRQLKQNRKLAIAELIFQALGLPVLTIAFIYSTYLDSLENAGDADPTMLIIPAALSLVCALVSGIMIAINVFSYLHKKSDVDMIYALPMNTSQRFISDYLVGWAIYIVPFLLSVIVSIIIHEVAIATVPAYGDMILEVSELHRLTLEKLVFDYTVIVTLATTFFYTLTVFVICCCGSASECVVYTLLINALIPLSLYVFFAALMDECNGIESYSILTTVLAYTSLIGVSIYAIDNIPHGYYTFELIPDSHHPENTATFVDPFKINPVLMRWLIIFTLIVAALIVACYFLYKFRKAEDVSKPFVYKLLYYVISTSVVFCAASVACVYPSTTVAMLLFGFIVFIIMEIVTNRGFAKFFKGVIRYVITATALIIVINAFQDSNYFGIETYIPSPDRVQSATISLQTRYNTQSREAVSFTATSLEEITEVTDFHSAALYVAEKVEQNYDDQNTLYSDYTITYVMKSGRTVERYYEYASIDAIPSFIDELYFTYDRIGRDYEAY